MVIHVLIHCRGSSASRRRMHVTGCTAVCHSRMHSPIDSGSRHILWRHWMAIIRGVGRRCRDLCVLRILHVNGPTFCLTVGGGHRSSALGLRGGHSSGSCSLGLCFLLLPLELHTVDGNQSGQLHFELTDRVRMGHLDDVGNALRSLRSLR